MTETKTIGNEYVLIASANQNGIVTAVNLNKKTRFKIRYGNTVPDKSEKGHIFVASYDVPNTTIGASTNCYIATKRDTQVDVLVSIL